MTGIEFVSVRGRPKLARESWRYVAFQRSVFVYDTALPRKAFTPQVTTIARALQDVVLIDEIGIFRYWIRRIFDIFDPPPYERIPDSYWKKANQIWADWDILRQSQMFFIDMEELRLDKAHDGKV